MSNECGDSIEDQPSSDDDDFDLVDLISAENSSDSSTVRFDVVDRVYATLSADAQRGDGVLQRGDVNRIYLRKELSIAECVAVEERLIAAGYQILDKEDEADPENPGSRDRRSQYRYLKEAEEKELGRRIQLASRLPEDTSGLDSTYVKRVRKDAERAKATFVASNIRYVEQIARRMGQQRHLTFEDITQEGFIGLLHATNLYDPELGFRFKTYATWWIEQRIRRAIADGDRTIRLPVHIQEKMARIRRSKAKLTLTRGRPPTLDELAIAVGTEPEKLMRLLWWVHATDCAEGDEPIGGEGATLLSLVPDEAESAFDLILYQELQERFNKLVSLLAPTVSVLPNLSGQSSDAEAKILVLTAEQVEAFAGLRASRGGLIVGGAGAGKTVLAIARAQQLARDGFRTLLVCYNELLGSDLSARAHKPPYLTASTFHSLCLSEAQRAKLEIPKAKPPEWWESAAPNLLIDACAVNGSVYDAIVVDEGQDFSPLWLDSLRCLLSTQADAPFFIFADPLQDIWKRDWLQGTEHSFVWQLTRNLRNTHPIAARVAAAVNTDCRDKGVPGPTPLWQRSDGVPGENEVLLAVERLLGEGFGPSNLVVLCGSATLVARLRERTVGGYSFGQWGGRGIVVETVSRFKGLEAQAVILALSPISATEDRTEAYVGMSRARSVLVVIGRETDHLLLNWPTPEL